MDDSQKWKAVLSLIDELNADMNRPEGRWGLHGHTCVDDDYFSGCEYAIAKLEAIRDA